MADEREPVGELHVGAIRRRPTDSNVVERWNGEEWLFYRWRDITKTGSATVGTRTRTWPWPVMAATPKEEQ
jgi:hypothetical protein